MPASKTPAKKPAAKKPAAKKPASKPSGAKRPVIVTQFTRRSDEDALPGSWVDVVAGEHEGRRGAYVGDESHGKDGYPARVLVRTRDAENELLVVNYSDIRPSSYTGGR